MAGEDLVRVVPVFAVVDPAGWLVRVGSPAP
jgi:hypothetical protein